MRKDPCGRARCEDDDSQMGPSISPCDCCGLPILEVFSVNNKVRTGINLNTICFVAAINGVDQPYGPDLFAESKR